MRDKRFIDHLHGTQSKDTKKMEKKKKNNKINKKIK